MFLPTTCASCDVPAAGAICPSCVWALAPPPSLDLPPGVSDAVAVCSHEGAGRAAVVGLKYHGRRAAAAAMGEAMAQAALQAGWPAADLVTWVPTSPQRRRRRGFDQAALLASGVARASGTPRARLVRRRSSGSRPQTAGGREARLGLLDSGAVVAAPRARARLGAAAVPPSGARVLLVDDVWTTGASLGAVAAVVLASGAREVRAVTFTAAG